ncbi:hypothetical protein AVEN_162077-1 [Araneus ventricosus]|uniref:Uncharacterized protein n=1 Tax=Araneus ventricosus TaxID=182803 RepID=A0A4Y2MFB0_ARAVE|nr:hypothetical protein AVEN_162077-1 [Araneus ventricosus]
MVYRFAFHQKNLLIGKPAMLWIANIHLHNEGGEGPMGALFTEASGFFEITKNTNRGGITINPCGMAFRIGFGATQLIQGLLDLGSN